MQRKDFAHAEQLYREALQAYAKTLPAEHINVGITNIKLGRALLRQQKYVEAELHSLQGYTILSKQANPSVGWLKNARTDLGEIYDALHQPDKARRFRAELAE
jgi:serine/threonine-protein kinase